jgi:type II secretory pathway component GspD/PulD (secretin)
MYFTAVCRSGLSRPPLARQTIKFMKLTTVLLFAACLQVSANGFSQRVTIKENNVTLRQVFEEIRKQTGIQFFYAVNTMQVAKPVSISVKNEPLDKVLELCFRDQELTYTISENTIIVKRKTATPDVNDPPVVMPEPVNTVIKGQVTDDKGQPMNGVSVTVKGSTSGTVTDANGNYSISVPDDAVLVFSYVGFINMELSLPDAVHWIYP